MRIVKFYRAESGNCPVEDFLKGLPEKQSLKGTFRNLHIGSVLIKSFRLKKVTNLQRALILYSDRNESDL